jgi:uridine kinase
MESIVIGIAGGTGSGKSTVAKKLYQEFSRDAVILSHDYYYKDNAGMTFEERSKLNYDHPNSLDTDLLVEHVKLLKSGEPIKHPTYDFAKHQITERWETIKPCHVIIVEGILIFTNQELCDLCDIKLFVDTDADVRFIRRLRRDVNRRGRSMESVVNQYLTTVKPMHEQFVEPAKRKADLIIPEGGQNTVAMATIKDTIYKKLAEAKKGNI